MADPVKEFEHSLAVERVAARFLRTAMEMNVGEFYVLKTTSSFHEDLYFRVESIQKNRNYKGTMVVHQLERPRARPRAKTTSVDKVWANQWKPIAEGALPDKVKASFAARRPSNESGPDPFDLVAFVKDST
jgi:hypothetical protein